MKQKILLFAAVFLILTSLISIILATSIYTTTITTKTSPNLSVPNTPILNPSQPLALTNSINITSGSSIPFLNATLTITNITTNYTAPGGIGNINQYATMNWTAQTYISILYTGNVPIFLNAGFLKAINLNIGSMKAYEQITKNGVIQWEQLNGNDTIIGSGLNWFKVTGSVQSGTSYDWSYGVTTANVVSEPTLNAGTTITIGNTVLTSASALNYSSAKITKFPITSFNIDPTWTAPSGVVYVLNLSINNVQSGALKAGTPVNVIINASVYNSYWDGSLNNMEAFNGITGATVPMWIEGNILNEKQTTALNSVNTIQLWITLPFGIAASTNAVNVISLGWMPQGTSVFGANTGIAPQLTTYWGQYDDGANVFTEFYSNFSCFGAAIPCALPSTWNSLNLVSNTNENVYVQNGLAFNYQIIAASVSGLQTTSAYANDVYFDSLMTGYTRSSSSSNPSFYFEQGLSTVNTGAGSYENGYQSDRSGVTGTTLGMYRSGGSASVTQVGSSVGVTALPTIESIYWNTTSAAANEIAFETPGNAIYQHDATQALTGKVFFSITEHSSSNGASANVLWSRARTIPIANVMPTITLGTVQQSYVVPTTPTLTLSNTLIDQGQSILFTANIVSTQGTAPFSYAYNVYAYNSGTSSNVLIGNQLYTGNSYTSNTWFWTPNANLYIGNSLFFANVVVTDAHPTTVNSILQYLGYNSVFLIGTPTETNSIIDIGQDTLQTANPSQGTQPYGSYQWYTIAGSTAPKCTASNTIAGATSSTYLGSPTTTNSYAYQAQDSATTANSACSSGDTVTVNAMPYANVILSNTLLDSGQFLTLTGLLGGGAAPFTYNLINITGNERLGTGNFLVTTIAGSNTFTMQVTSPTNSNTFTFTLNGVDYGTTANYVFNSPYNSLTINTVPTISISTSNVLLDANQLLTWTVTGSGGSGKENVQLFNASNSFIQNGQANVLLNTIGGSNTFTIQTSAVGLVSFAVNSYDEGTTFPFVINSITQSVTVNPSLGIPPLAVSNTLADSGQYETLNTMISGGTTPFTVNFYNITGSTTGQIFGYQQWLAATPYPTTINRQSCVAYSNSIYCIGGLFGVVTANVFSAQVLGSGLLGSWVLSANSYPSTGDKSSCVTYSNNIYCIGGFGTAITSNVFYAPIYQSGAIGTWTATTPYPIPNQLNSCVTYSNNIYCIGGADVSSTSNVDYAPILSTGGLGSWTLSANSYPTLINRQSCVTYSNNIYCVAGEPASGVTSANVFYAPIYQSGAIGTWTATTPYTTVMAQESCVTNSNNIYCIGGSDGTVLANVLYAPILSAGGLGSWTISTSYPAAQDLQSCVTNINNVYCVGGAQGTSNAVYYAPLSAQGVANTLNYTFQTNSPTQGNVFNWNVILTDSASTPVTANSITNSFTVNAYPTLSISASNTLLDSGQYTTFTITEGAGTGTAPFTVELYNITGASKQGANVIIPIIGGSNTITIQTSSPTEGNTFSYNAIATDYGTTSNFIFNSPTQSIEVNEILQVTISPTSNTINTGQSQTMTAIVTPGWPSYTYNFIAANTAGFSANLLVVGNSFTQNQFIFTPLAVGTYNVNVVVTDSSPAGATIAATANSIITVTNTAYTPPSGLTFQDSNGTLQELQPELFKASFINGLASYTYNYQVVNAITGNLIANQLYTSALTSNSWLWIPNVWIAGNSLKANVIITDAHGTTINSISLSINTTTASQTCNPALGPCTGVTTSITTTVPQQIVITPNSTISGITAILSAIEKDAPIAIKQFNLYDALILFAKFNFSQIVIYAWEILLILCLVFAGWLSLDELRPWGFVPLLILALLLAYSFIWLHMPFNLL